MRQTLPGSFGDVHADARRTGERDLVDVWVHQQRLADVRPAAGHHIQYARRQELRGDLRHLQDGERRLLGRLQDQRVAGGERCRRLHSGDHQRRIPRQNSGHDAEGFPASVLQLIVTGRQNGTLEFTGDTAEITEQVDQGLRFRAGLGPQGITGVGRGEQGQFLGPRLEGIGDPEQRLLPILEMQRTPGWKCLAGGGHRPVGVRPAADRHPGQHGSPAAG